jgi:dihydroflavonol-4-reductase
VRAFVTGATGLLGRHLVGHLLAQGDDVGALARTFDRARTLPAGVRTVAGDVTRPASLRAGMRGAEVVYHLAAARQPGRRPKDLARLERINVEGTQAVLALAAELAVPRVVYVSDLAVFGDTGGQPVNKAAALPPYAASKHRAHAVALQAARAGLPLTLVCPGALVGPADDGWLGRILGRYARRSLWAVVGGESAYSFVSAASVADGLRLAAVRGQVGETYCLPGPALTLRLFFAEAQRVTGLPAPFLWLPPGLARLLGRLAARVRPDLAEAASHYSGGAVVGDVAEAERELGWRPAPLAAALREAVDWHMEQERLRREAARAAREPAANTERSP